MRPISLTLAIIILAGVSATASAQRDESGTRTYDCGTYSGTERSVCLDNQKRAKESAAKGGVNAKDAKLINETKAASQTKAAAGDLAGATALYDQAIAASPKSAVLHFLYLGRAMGLRRQGVAAYNAGGQPSYPPAGSSNMIIAAANAANAALAIRKVEAAKPFIIDALRAATQAANAADAQPNKAADAAIGVELREDASLLYQFDRTAVLTASRPSAEIEAVWLRRWLVGTDPLPADQVARYGVAVAAALVAKDQAAGLTLADEVRAKTGSDPDGIIGYAEIVSAAKSVAGSDRRSRALADLAAAAPGVTDAAKKDRIKQLTTALSS